MPTQAHDGIDYAKIASRSTNALAYMVLVLVGITIGYAIWQKVKEEKNK